MKSRHKLIISANIFKIGLAELKLLEGSSIWSNPTQVGLDFRKCASRTFTLPSYKKNLPQDKILQVPKYLKKQTKSENTVTLH